MACPLAAAQSTPLEATPPPWEVIHPVVQDNLLPHHPSGVRLAYRLEMMMISRAWTVRLGKALTGSYWSVSVHQMQNCLDLIAETSREFLFGYEMSLKRQEGVDSDETMLEVYFVFVFLIEWCNIAQRSNKGLCCFREKLAAEKGRKCTGKNRRA